MHWLHIVAVFSGYTCILTDKIFRFFPFTFCICSFCFFLFCLLNVKWHNQSVTLITNLMKFYGLCHELHCRLKLFDGKFCACEINWIYHCQIIWQKCPIERGKQKKNQWQNKQLTLGFQIHIQYTLYIYTQDIYRFTEDMKHRMEFIQSNWHRMICRLIPKYLPYEWNQMHELNTINNKIVVN